METRVIKGGARAGATALGAAAWLLILATTAQTRDGFVHASVGGQRDVFGETALDIVVIGDGASDASELAALLKAPGATGLGSAELPFRHLAEAGANPGATADSGGTADPVGTGPGGLPTADPVTGVRPNPDGAGPPARPVVDQRGQVDCSGAVSCDTDPVTRITTVTYPDGVVAKVRKVNDLTVIAYQALEWLPVVEGLTPPLAAASADPSAVPAPEPVAQTPPPSPDSAPPDDSAPPAFPGVDPGPPAPDAVTPGGDGHPRGPMPEVTPPSLEFSPDDDPGSDRWKPSPPKSEPSGLDKAKDALGSAVDGVRDAVGGVIGRSASEPPEKRAESEGGQPGDGGQLGDGGGGQ